MSLLDPSASTPPALQTPRLIAQVQREWYIIQNLFSSISQYIWNNPTLTPQQAFNTFGTNAADLCKLSNAYLAMLQAYTGSATSPVPVGTTIAINSDGTVTVSVQQGS